MQIFQENVILVKHLLKYFFLNLFFKKFILAVNYSLTIIAVFLDGTTNKSSIPAIPTSSSSEYLQLNLYSNHEPHPFSFNSISSTGSSRVIKRVKNTLNLGLEFLQVCVFYKHNCVNLFHRFKSCVFFPTTQSLEILQQTMFHIVNIFQLELIKKVAITVYNNKLLKNMHAAVFAQANFIEKYITCKSQVKDVVPKK